MRWVLIICLILAAGLCQAAPTTAWADAAGLENLGFTQSAYDAYVKAEDTASASDKPAVLLGELRCLLALQKSSQARALLPRLSEINASGQALYDGLICLQEGNVMLARQKLALVQKAELGGDEVVWADFAKGLLATYDGKLNEAEAVWAGLKDSHVEGFIEALGGTSGAPVPTFDDAKSLDKRFRRLRDWPVIKLYALALAKAGNADVAMKLLERQANPERWLVMAQISPKGADGRRDKILNALSVSQGAAALSALRLALDEPQITLIELQNLWSERPSRSAEGALILCDAWRAKNDLKQAVTLWGDIDDAKLGAAWLPYYYWMGVQLDYAQTPPYFRQAAELLKKWEKVSSDPAQKQKLYGEIADDIFKAAAYAEAAGLYEANLDGAPEGERNRRLSQAVLAYMKAGSFDNAKRVLVANNWEGFAPSLLEYLRVLSAKGASMDDLMAPFAGRELSAAEHWPIDYLRFNSLGAQIAMGDLNAYLAKLSDNAPWKINFELLSYDWLLEKSPTDAYAYMESLVAKYPENSDILRRQIEMTLSRHQPIEALLQKMSQLKELGLSDRARILLAAAQSERDAAALLEQAQKLIADIPAGGDRETLVLWLLKIKVQQGNAKEALSGCDRLLEGNLSQAMRDKTELLRASVLEVLGDPTSESAYLGLTQRADEAIRLRSQSRLAVYYLNHDQKEEALELLKHDLLPAMVETDLSAEVLRDLAYAYANLYSLLPVEEADMLQKWLEDYAPSAGV